MKRISFLSIICLLCAGPIVRAQAPAASQEIEENYKRLKGVVDDMHEAQDALQKRITALQKEISELREEQSKPHGDYATREELKHLAETIQEIDRKREADNERILKEISKLGKTIASTPPPRNTTSKPPRDTKSKPEADAGPAHDEDGFNYTIKSNDSFVSIAKAYRDSGVKVTSDQIAKANPNVNPGKLFIGQKIWIPAPKQAGTK
jgi:TolA-binding protein